MLEQQREDYESRCRGGGLTEKLERQGGGGAATGEAEDDRRRLVGVERDRNRQSQQVTGLGRQVTALVRGGGRNFMDTLQPMDSSTWPSGSCSSLATKLTS